MKPRDYYHIADLVRCYLNDSATPEQLLELQEWLAESEFNQMLLDSFKGKNAISDFEFIASLNEDEAWNGFHIALTDSVNHQKNPQRRWIHRHWIGIAAMLIAVVSIVLFITYQYPAEEPEIFYTENHFKNDVAPAENRAVLYLSDGTEVNLAEYMEGLEEQDGTMISRKGDGLVYGNDGKSRGNLIFNKLVVPKAGTYQITLSDGTRVWLNAMSELDFPVVFDDDRREVRLTGEAYFEVAHDSKRPFHVYVGDNNKIEVLGTDFNVNAYSSVLSATLVNGSVKVFNGTKDKLLLPGQEALISLDASSEDIVVQEANMMKALAWKEGDFYFNSDNIAAIMEELSRWYDVHVNFLGSYPVNKGYSGSIRRNVNISQVLEMLTYVSGAVFMVDGDEISVRFNNENTNDY